jgi:two-component system, OmpR family, sensor histidine kinase ChvG
MGESGGRTAPRPSALRSLRVQGIALLAVLVVLPTLLYGIFSQFERNQRELLVSTVRDAGNAIAAGLAPTLRDLQPADFGNLDAELARFADPRRRVVLLFHPQEGGAHGEFFFVASVPQVQTGELDSERARLAELGVLPKLAASCSGYQPLTERVGGADGGSIITSLTGVQGPAGCWAIVIAVDAAGLLAGIDPAPARERRVVQLAAVVYVVMAGLVLLIFANVRADLRRFRRLALSPGDERRFRDVVDTPEMASLADAVDGMVLRLHQTAETLRQAAEDNAHAFKGPIAIIRQVTEPLAGQGENSPRLAAALAAVQVALERLDGLIASARRLDTATADLLEGGGVGVADVTALLQGLVVDNQAMHANDPVRIVATLAPDVRVIGETEVLENVFENLLDNALDFSPPGGTVWLTLSVAAGEARVTVRDEGPGVPEADLSRIFERYYSDRRRSRSGSPAAGSGHFGIGLWIARHNARALGGDVSAANASPRGLMVVVRLKLVRDATGQARKQLPSAQARVGGH